MLFLSKHGRLILKTQSGYIRFEKGAYQTDDKTNIEALRKHDQFGFLFCEEVQYAKVFGLEDKSSQAIVKATVETLSKEVQLLREQAKAHQAKAVEPVHTQAELEKAKGIKPEIKPPSKGKGKGKGK